jgi:hypothetical protein
MARTGTTRQAGNRSAQARGRQRPGDNPAQMPSEDELRRRIAENAYYRALARGFDGGNPVADWLEAERDICGGEPDRDTAH